MCACICVCARSRRVALRCESWREVGSCPLCCCWCSACSCRCSCWSYAAGRGESARISARLGSARLGSALIFRVCVDEKSCCTRSSWLALKRVGDYRHCNIFHERCFRVCSVVLTRVTFTASPTVMFPSSEAKGGVAWGHCGTEVLVVPFQTRAHDGSVLRSMLPQEVEEDQHAHERKQRDGG